MRFLRLGFALAAYLLFFLTFLYLVGFVGNFVVPRTVDSGTGAGTGVGVALVTDVLLIALFGVQHSVMARPAFKAALTRTVHPAIERSVYVLATVAVLWITFALWQPIPRVIWAVESPGAQQVLWALFAIGWAIVFISTWLLNHFELFGLQQVWFDFRNRPEPQPKFRQPLFYKLVRHPLYVGFLFAVWAIPVMTAGHLLLAIGWTIYILIAIRYEERDLTAVLGVQYIEYRQRVGMLIPGVGKTK